MEFAPALRDELRQESRKVAQSLGIKYISSQELVKIEAEFGTEPGKQAKAAMDAGLQVDTSSNKRTELRCWHGSDSSISRWILQSYVKSY